MRLLISDQNSDKLWEVTSLSDPVGVVDLGTFPSGLTEPFGMTFHDERLFICDNNGVGIRGELWEISDPDSPGGATSLGLFPTNLDGPAAMASHASRLFVTEGNSDTLWEITDPDNPGSATSLGTFPSTLSIPAGMTSHDGRLLIADISGRQLFEITDPDSPSGATSLGVFPTNLTDPHAMTSHDGRLFVTDGVGDELWEVTDPDTPSGATKIGDLPSGLTEPFGMTSYIPPPVSLGARITSDAPQIRAQLAVTNPSPVSFNARITPGAPQMRVQLAVTNPFNLRARITLGAPQVRARLTVTNSPLVSLRARVTSGAPQIRARLIVSSTTDDLSRAQSFGLAGQRPLYALEISHPDITDNIRIISDTQHATIEGNDYVALAFRARMPQDKEHEIRQASIEIDNVGRRMVRWVEAAQGGRGARMRVMEVVVDQSRAAQITWELPALDVGMARLTNEALRVSLVDEGATQAPAVKLRHDPATSPGLF